MSNHKATGKVCLPFSLNVCIDELYEKYRRERNLDPHEPFPIRNIVAFHKCFRRLIDHPEILPLIVDVMGFNSTFAARKASV